MKHRDLFATHTKEGCIGDVDPAERCRKSSYNRSKNSSRASPDWFIIEFSVDFFSSLRWNGTVTILLDCALK